MPDDNNIAALKEWLRTAPSITLFQNNKGEVYLGLGTTRMLTTADEIDAVADVMVERLRDPDARPEMPS